MANKKPHELKRFGKLQPKPSKPRIHVMKQSGKILLVLPSGHYFRIT